MAFDLGEVRARRERASQEVFRLEWLPIYNVPSDNEEFARWRRGEPTAADDPDNDYYVALRRARDRGVRSIRARVIDFPVNDYLRYEVDFYKGSQQNGEEIFFLERAIAVNCMQQSVVTGDYWLFDNSEVLVFEYDDSGDLTGQHAVDDPSLQERYKSLRDCLLGGALSMNDFIERFSESFAAPQATP